MLAYFERGGLEKQRGGPTHSSYSRGNTDIAELVEYDICQVNVSHSFLAWTTLQYFYLIKKTPGNRSFNQIYDTMLESTAPLGIHV